MMIRSCAFRGRSQGDWHASEHRQKLELGCDIVSNCISSVAKDFCLVEYSSDMAQKEIDSIINMPEELRGKKFRIRKLTPRECFRLMGVDDKDIDTMQAAGISQGGQYKLAGNSIVVDVLFHIFRRMFIDTEEPDFDGNPTQLTLF